jgi:phosphinothricin acetyltransferase
MIRSLEERDIARCLEIYNWYIIHSNATFETEELSLPAFTDRVHSIISRYPWIVLEEEGKVLGYAYLSAFNERAAYDWTCDLAIYLDQAERGHGYGTALMKAILQLARDDGYHQMTSIITEGNAASERLHEKCGFEHLVFFPKVGYKAGKWLGVDYYICHLNDTEEANPIHNIVIK